MESMKQFIEMYGTQSNAGKAVGVSQATVWGWLHGTHKVSPRYALKIEKLTEGKIHRSNLRPDIYPPDDYAYRSEGC